EDPADAAPPASSVEEFAVPAVLAFHQSVTSVFFGANSAVPLRSSPVSGCVSPGVSPAAAFEAPVPSAPSAAGAEVPGRGFLLAPGLRRGSPEVVPPAAPSAPSSVPSSAGPPCCGIEGPPPGTALDVPDEFDEDGEDGVDAVVPFPSAEPVVGAPGRVPLRPVPICPVPFCPVPFCPVPLREEPSEPLPSVPAERSSVIGLNSAVPDTSFSDGASPPCVNGAKAVGTDAPWWEPRCGRPLRVVPTGVDPVGPPADPDAGDGACAGTSSVGALWSTMTTSLGTRTTAVTPVTSLPPRSCTSKPCLPASRPTTNRPIRREVAMSTGPASVSRPLAS